MGGPERTVGPGPAMVYARDLVQLPVHNQVPWPLARLSLSLEPEVTLDRPCVLVKPSPVMPLFAAVTQISDLKTQRKGDLHLS